MQEVWAGCVCIGKLQSWDLTSYRVAKNYHEKQSTMYGKGSLLQMKSILAQPEIQIQAANDILETHAVRNP